MGGVCVLKGPQDFGKQRETQPDWEQSAGNSAGLAGVLSGCPKVTSGLGCASSGVEWEQNRTPHSAPNLRSVERLSRDKYKQSRGFSSNENNQVALVTYGSWSESTV